MKFPITSQKWANIYDRIFFSLIQQWLKEKVVLLCVQLFIKFKYVARHGMYILDSLMDFINKNF